MTTFFAPAARCIAALSRAVNRPVDSMTTCTPSLLHGSLAGSRSASTCSGLPSRKIVPPSTFTSWRNVPWMESYFSRCASVAALVMSLTATTSRSFLVSAARRNILPIRPNPLIPTFIATARILQLQVHLERNDPNLR